eukprot:scaffold121240_cov17-Tisochrysis_lutea.AAC.3
MAWLAGGPHFWHEHRSQPPDRGAAAQDQCAGEAKRSPYHQGTYVTGPQHQHQHRLWRTRCVLQCRNIRQASMHVFHAFKALRHSLGFGALGACFQSVEVEMGPWCTCQAGACFII